MRHDEFDLILINGCFSFLLLLRVLEVIKRVKNNHCAECVCVGWGGGGC